MARVILIALAGIAAVLGFLMENDLLLLIAGGVLVLALITLLVLAAQRRRRRNELQKRGGAGAHEALASREAELRAVGISDIRPRGAASVEAHPTEEPATEAEPEVVVAGGAAATPEDGPLPEHTAEAEPAEQPAEAEPLPTYEAREDSPFWRLHSPAAVTAYLRALWATTDLQSVTLFSREAGRDTYTLEAALSHNPAIRREGRFPSSDFFASVAPDRPLTILEANDPLVRSLPHYKREVHVGGAAVLPAPASPDATAFLVVDLAPDQTAFSERQRDLLVRFADLLGAMLAQPEGGGAPRATPTRRSIIAGEMERARDEGRPLALALVYRDDAEAIAERGPDAVAAAERDLRLHLEDLTPEGRVERFSELVYGAFLYDTPDAIEAWVRRVRGADGEQSRLPLVAGVARLTHHNDPDELRADAFNALQVALAEREAYVIA